MFFRSVWCGQQPQLCVRHIQQQDLHLQQYTATTGGVHQSDRGDGKTRKHSGTSGQDRTARYWWTSKWFKLLLHCQISITFNAIFPFFLGLKNQLPWLSYNTVEQLLQYNMICKIKINVTYRNYGQILFLIHILRFTQQTCMNADEPISKGYQVLLEV